MSLGLWIDLTFTKRFYDQEVVESKGIKYVKLQCRGYVSLVEGYIVNTNDQLLALALVIQARRDAGSRASRII